MVLVLVMGRRAACSFGFVFMKVFVSGVCHLKYNSYFCRNAYTLKLNL